MRADLIAVVLVLPQPPRPALSRLRRVAGLAFPASPGVKCARPDRPVICFTGDGGFYYHLGEMETARRFGLNTVTLVNNNSGLGQCRNPIERLYQDRSGRSEDMYAFSS